MSRDWTDDELAVINTTTRSWVRRSKLSPELVKRIKERVDSLSQPWTVAELAAEFGVSKTDIAQIARRQAWDDPVYEPKEYER